MKKAISAILASLTLLSMSACALRTESPQNFESSPPPEVTISVSQTTLPTETQPPETVTTSETTTPPPVTTTETEPEEVTEAEITTAIEVSPPETEKVYPDCNTIYLTFDDGPGPYTEELLDILDKYNVKATFFVVDGRYSDLIAEEYNRGHTVGIHSASHNYEKIYSSEDAYFQDFNEMDDIILEQTGERAEIFRFPGGSSNTVSSFTPGIMTILTEKMTNMGYVYFDWNVSSGDAGKTTETSQVAENVITGVQKHQYSVVLQHDVKYFSVQAVEEIIIWGLENGYAFEPLTKDSPIIQHHVAN